LDLPFAASRWGYEWFGKLRKINACTKIDYQQAICTVGGEIAEHKAVFREYRTVNGDSGAIAKNRIASSYGE
jgi:hypothetical protein